jgi:hypothetical protein
VETADWGEKGVVRKSGQSEKESEEGERRVRAGLVRVIFFDHLTYSSKNQMVIY